MATLLVASGIAFAQSNVAFKAVDPMGRNTVQFRTTAPLEDIVGTTNSIKGEIRVDPKNLNSLNVEGQLEVDLASLHTGIGLRDTHLREQCLHTDKYPKAVFTLEKIRKSSASKIDPNRTVSLIA